MDISNRSAHSQPSGQSGQTFAANNTNTTRRSKPSSDGKWSRIGLIAGLVAIVVLLVAVIGLSIADNNDKTKKQVTESSYVDSSKLQAVFLNTGQVYFGNIKSLNSKYFVVSNIYYLQTANGTNNASPNVTLVKLGCELHQPDDQMVINRDQVTFWENLHESGQVAKAVTNFKKDNPQGQKCADQSTSSSTDSTNATQNAGSSTKPNTAQ